MGRDQAALQHQFESEIVVLLVCIKTCVRYSREAQLGVQTEQRSVAPLPPRAPIGVTLLMLQWESTTMVQSVTLAELHKRVRGKSTSLNGTIYSATEQLSN